MVARRVSPGLCTHREKISGLTFAVFSPGSFELTRSRDYMQARSGGQLYRWPGHMRCVLGRTGNDSRVLSRNFAQ